MPFERGAGIRFHGQRRRGRAPRDGVHIGAAEAGRTAADVSGEVFRGQFERRQRRVLADLSGDNLIDCSVRQNVFGFGPFRPDARQETRGTDRMIADLAARMRTGETCYDDEGILEWF